MANRSLAETQKEFFSTLLLPLRGRSRKSTALRTNKEGHSDYFFEVAERQIKPTPTLIPAECLELYHRQYWFRILDSIEEDFPGLIRLLGEERFFGLVEGYFLQRPSKSYTLRHLGAEFSAYLENNIKESPMRERAVAVAEIEYGLMRAFEAKSLPGATPEEITSGPFTLQPCVFLFSQKSNASAWLDEEADWAEGDFFAAVWRTVSGSLRHGALAAGEFAMLKKIQGQTRELDAWLEESVADIDDMGELTRWFADWREAGWFALSKSPLKSEL